MGGEKARNNFSRNTRMMRTKNVAKKILAKNCEKKVFFMHTNMVTKKWGEKTHLTIFPETHQQNERKMLEKNRRKKFENFFFKSTRIS